MLILQGRLTAVVQVSARCRTVKEKCYLGCSLNFGKAGIQLVWSAAVFVHVLHVFWIKVQSSLSSHSWNPTAEICPYFSLKFGCKTVTRGEDRFNLVLGPGKLWQLFTHSVPSVGALHCSGQPWAQLAWAATRGSGSDCTRGALQTENRH